MKFLVYAFLFVTLWAVSYGVNADFEGNEVNFDVTDTIKKSEKVSKPKKFSSHDIGEIGERQRLINFILSEGYDKRNYPTNMTIKLGVALLKVDVDERKSTLEADVWIRMTWSDKRLAWDKSEFDVPVLRMRAEEVWRPDITLYNSASPFEMMKCTETNTLIYPNGDVLWVPPCHLSALCNLTLNTDPYGIQTCILKFGSWTFDGLSQDLQIYNNETKADVSDMWQTTDWNVVSNNYTREVKYYDCCTEPYVSLTYNLGIQRKSIPSRDNRRCQF